MRVHAQRAGLSAALVLAIAVGAVGALAPARASTAEAPALVDRATDVAESPSLLASPVATAIDDEGVANGVAQSDGALVIVLDLSGSMRDDDGTGTIKLQAAKRAVERVIRQQGEGAVVGVWVYPTGSDCGAGEYIIEPEPIADLNRTIAMVDTMSASGGTPTGAALRGAVDRLKAEGLDHATVVLVSDGESNCGSPPCPVARELAATDFLVTVDAVGFQLSSAGREELTCVAQATGGRYFDANDSDELVERLDALASPLLRVEARYPLTAHAGSSASIEVEVTNSSSRDASAVKVNLAFHAVHAASLLPAVFPPTVLLGNIPAGKTLTAAWQVSTGARDQDSEARFRITAWGADAGAAQTEGTISVTSSGLTTQGLGDLLSGVRDDGRTLVIMGDSFSSGEGTRDYVSDGDPCHRSLQTYVAPAFHETPGQLELIACSGAVSGNVHAPQHRGSSSVGSRSQLDQLREVTGPGAVLLTFGGNDIGFASIILRCIAWGTCTSDSDYLARLAQTIVGVELPLRGVYREVWEEANGADDLRARGGDHAPVVVLGYPQITHDESAGGCPNFDVTEVAFANGLVNALNAVIKKAVAETRDEGYEIYFAAPVQSAFLPDHTYCAKGSDAYVNGISIRLRPVLAKRWDGLPLIYSEVEHVESFHPKTSGYTAMTAALYTWLSSVDAVAPEPRKMPARDDSWTRRVTDGLLSWDRVDLNTPNRPRLRPQTSAEVTGFGFEAGSDVSLMLHSAPVTLGTFLADDKGRLRADVWIPEGVGEGEHILAAWGFDEEGDPVELKVMVAVVPPIPASVVAAALAAALALLAGLALAARGFIRLAAARRSRPSG